MSRTTRLAPTDWMECPSLAKRPSSRTRPSPRSRFARCVRNRRRFSSSLRGFRRRTRGRNVLRELFRRLLEGHENAGSPCSTAPRTRNSMLKQGFARAGAPDEQRRAPLGSPPAGSRPPVDPVGHLPMPSPQTPSPSERHLFSSSRDRSSSRHSPRLSQRASLPVPLGQPVSIYMFFPLKLYKPFP